MTRLFGIAAVQMNILAWEPEAAVERMSEFIPEIRENFPWVDLICFPELISTGLEMYVPMSGIKTWKQLAQPIPGPLTEVFSRMARENQVWLVPGSVFEQDGSEIYNTALAISPQGELVARYRKIFPWQPWEASTPGSDFCVFDIPGAGRFGLAICYDGWYPELIRTLSWMGAEVILHPVLTMTADRDAELIIEQAMAIIGNCFMVDVNCVGEAGGGRSLIVDPHGRVLQQAGNHQEVLTQMIDLDVAQQARKFGTLGLNQHMKQLRDFLRTHEFPVYKDSEGLGEVFRKLGPIEFPGRLRVS